MFTHQTILWLRVLTPDRPSPLPVFGHFRDYHFARNVMEAKQYLLRCLHRMNQAHFPTPDVILLDAGPDNADIKTELERWMDLHPRLGRVKVIFPAKLPWIRRCWKQWIRREGTTITVRDRLRLLFSAPAPGGCG